MQCSAYLAHGNGNAVGIGSCESSGSIKLLPQPAADLVFKPSQRPQKPPSKESRLTIVALAILISSGRATNGSIDDLAIAQLQGFFSSAASRNNTPNHLASRTAKESPTCASQLPNGTCILNPTRINIHTDREPPGLSSTVRLSLSPIGIMLIL